jgi:flagellar export protein FliJ
MTKTAWSILDQIAETKVNEARESVSKANQILKKITAQKVQLLEMLDDYQKRLKIAQENSHSIDQNISYRHFIKQVQELLEVISNEEKEAEKKVQIEEDILIDALKDKKKAEFLINRDEQFLTKKNQKLEQKSFDEIAISRFNQ